MKQWNILKLALFGAAIGTVYGAVQAIGYWSGGNPRIMEAVGTVIGGAIGGAAIAAIACVIRNRFAR